MEALRHALRDPTAAAPPVAERLGTAVSPAEGRLLGHLRDVLAAFRALDAGDRARALAVLLTLTQGMLEVLERFPPEAAGRVAALETWAELDRYTYLNAGCVGEFWTDMLVAHRPACAGWDVAVQRARGIRFGQGLQLVNVLRDLPRDLRAGRCYLPREALADVGLAPEDLLRPDALGRARGLVTRLVDDARGRLESGRAYTLAIPRREPRLRLAAAWPLLIGLATLGRLRHAGNLLDPTVTVKITRRELRRLLARSVALAWSDRGLSAYAERLAADAPSA